MSFSDVPFNISRYLILQNFGPKDKKLVQLTVHPKVLSKDNISRVKSRNLVLILSLNLCERMELIGNIAFLLCTSLEHICIPSIIKRLVFVQSRDACS